jgi:hypothetical protein
LRVEHPDADDLPGQGPQPEKMAISRRFFSRATSSD